MAIAVGNRANSGAVTTSPITTAFTVTGVSPLFVAVVWQGVQTITSVKWNTSETLTNLSTLVGTSTNNVALFALKNPTATTTNVVATFSANPGSGAEMFIIGTTGGDTTTGWRTVYNRTQADGTGPGETVVDSVNGDIVFHAAVVTAATITWDAGETTTTTTANNIAGSAFSGGLSTKAAVGSSTVVGCTDAAGYAESATAAIGGSTAATFNLLVLGAGG